MSVAPSLSTLDDQEMSVASSATTPSQRRRKPVPVHRCRFPDWTPSAVAALTITPRSFDTALLNFGGASAERGILGVGRANGDVELMCWGGHQGWVAWRVSPGRDWLFRLLEGMGADLGAIDRLCRRRSRSRRRAPRKRSQSRSSPTSSSPTKPHSRRPTSRCMTGILRALRLKCGGGSTRACGSLASAEQGVSLSSGSGEDLERARRSGGSRCVFPP